MASHKKPRAGLGRKPKRGSAQVVELALLKNAMERARGGPTAVERIQDCQHAVRMALAKAADDESDLQQAREMLAQGDLSGALGQVIFILSTRSRSTHFVLSEDRRHHPHFVSREEVSDTGDINEEAQAALVAELLWYEGLGPRPRKDEGAK